MFDETWRRFVVKMATGAGKTKVLSLILAWNFYHRLYEPVSFAALIDGFSAYKTPAP